MLQLSFYQEISSGNAAEKNVAERRHIFTRLYPSYPQLWAQLSQLCKSSWSACCRNQNLFFMDRIRFSTLVSTLFVASMWILQESEGEDCGGCEAGSQEGCAPSENLIMMMIKMVIMMMTIKMVVKMMIKVMKRAPKRELRQTIFSRNIRSWWFYHLNLNQKLIGSFYDLSA